MQKRLRVRRAGFTLIELVIVLIIVATLAGLAIPLVSMIGRSADMAASAASQKEIANNIELYFVLQKRYPQGLDSLLYDGGASLYSHDVANAVTQTKGLPYAGADGTRLVDQLEITTLSGNFARSFTRCGFEYVYDHTTATVNPNDSASVLRDVSSGTITGLAGVKPGGALQLKVLPSGLNANGTSYLVALGVGGKNAAIGKTINTAPTYPGNDGRYYGRYVAVFQVFSTGERATLVGVIDSYGRTTDYTIQQFNESLPDGGRQG